MTKYKLIETDMFTGVPYKKDMEKISEILTYVNNKFENIMNQKELDSKDMDICQEMLENIINYTNTFGNDSDNKEYKTKLSLYKIKYIDDVSKNEIVVNKEVPRERETEVGSLGVRGETKYRK